MRPVSPSRSLVTLALAATLVGTLVASATVALACPPWRWPPPPDPRAAPRGRLSITAQPVATEVLLDGRALGYAPLLGHYLDAGTHSLRLRAACGEARRSLRIAPGQDVRLSIDVCRARRAPAPYPL
jgi:hypothetical protein